MSTTFAGKILKAEPSFTGLQVFSLIALALIFCSFGCGGGGSGGSATTPLTITGTVDDVLTAESLRAMDGSIGRSSMGRRGVDQVWAVPLLKDAYGRFDPAMFSSSYKKVFTIINGHFTITFTGTIDTDNWVLLLVNSDAADRADTIVSYVAVSDLDERLVQIPVKKMSGQLDLGNLAEDDEDDDEAVSETELEQFATKCSLSYGQLRKMAKTDDLVKTIRNIWVNASYDNDGEVSLYYQSSIQYKWHQSILEAKNQFSHAADDYMGYGIEVWFEEGDIAWSDLSNPAVDAVNFAPPSEVSINDFLNDVVSYTYDSNSPINSDGPYNPNLSEAYDNDLGFCAFKNANDLIRLQYAATPVHTWDGFSGTVPSGNWLLTDQGQTETYATFDFSMESPFRNDGTAKIYIPSLKITTDVEDEISGISIRWLLYDQRSELYETVSELDDFWSSASEVRMDLNCQTGVTWGSGWSITNINLLADQTTEITPQDNFYLNRIVDGGTNLVWVTVRYTFNGATFIHDWSTIR
jgi:hypothetical protein